MNQLNKKCHVCGDLASGFNYNGLSCESCKVFFHRNSSKMSELNCTKGGKCAVNKLSRKDCPKCRLEKCFLIGMRRRPTECSSADREIQNGIENFLEISILKRITKTDVTKLAEYMSLFPKHRKLVELNSYELERITEARNAESVFPDERKCTIVGTIRTKEEAYPLMNTTEYYVKKSINFCQNIPAFNSLKSEDQMAMLKPFIFDLLTLRFAFVVDLESNCILMYANDSGKEVVQIDETIYRDYKHQQLVEMSRNFVLSLHNELENDVIIRDLMSVLSLFKIYDNITCPEFVRYQYFFYTQLLIRYLEQKYRSKKDAKRKYNTLTELMSQLSMFKSNKRIILDEYDVNKLPPIVMELYDLVEEEQ